jgi:hypothetical protein
MNPNRVVRAAVRICVPTWSGSASDCRLLRWEPPCKLLTHVMSSSRSARRASSNRRRHWRASQHGAAVVEINPTTTPLTSRATFMLQGASGEILPALIKAVW